MVLEEQWMGTFLEFYCFYPQSYTETVGYWQTASVLLSRTVAVPLLLFATTKLLLPLPWKSPDARPVGKLPARKPTGG